ncbi:hypothetical protein ABZ401_19230 [Streptomyces sp. NPDC005892]|uniref:hypothetical protein n=1 Tax=Streptomyces sp. NPDC005892 TaxID=3155593 RepID=UPI003401D705
MGYASYSVTRNGQTIQAGYDVEAVCETTGCTEQIDRGLAYLCGNTPGGDEHGCGGYYCGQHLSFANQCQPCYDAATKAATWTHPGTGEEFDLRDHYLPRDATYDPRGVVWMHLDAFDGDTPLLTPVYAVDTRPTGDAARSFIEGDWEEAAKVILRQLATGPSAATVQG